MREVVYTTVIGANVIGVGYFLLEDRFSGEQKSTLVKAYEKSK